MIKAVLWDIDGTMVDSEPLHLRALLSTAETFSADLSKYSDNQFVGVNIRDVWQKLKHHFPDDLDYGTWLEQINTYYFQHAHSLAPIAFVGEVVSKLSELGFSQAAVSNSSRQIVDANLGYLGIEKQLRFSLSLDDVPAPKPSPLPYMKALKLLGLKANEVVAIEDSITGIASAKGANIFTIGLKTSHDELPGADLQIDDLKQVVEFFQSVKEDAHAV